MWSTSRLRVPKRTRKRFTLYKLLLAEGWTPFGEVEGKQEFLAVDQFWRTEEDKLSFCAYCYLVFTKGEPDLSAPLDVWKSLVLALYNAIEVSPDWVVIICEKMWPKQRNYRITVNQNTSLAEFLSLAKVACDLNYDIDRLYELVLFSEDKTTPFDISQVTREQAERYSIRHYGMHNQIRLMRPFVYKGSQYWFEAKFRVLKRGETIYVCYCGCLLNRRE